MNNAITISKYGKPYNHPDGLTEDKYYELMNEFVDLAKAKGLTVRQAQCLFNDCSDAVLSTRLDSSISNEELKSISENIDKIANRGIDVFCSCVSTNTEY